MAKSAEHEPVRSVGGRRRCPICGKPSATRHRPFCSGRCADVDLGRWLKGNYRVETEEQPDASPDTGDGDH